MPENFEQPTETEKKQERAESRDLSPEQIATQLEQTDKAIGLTIEDLNTHIAPQLFEKQQRLSNLSSSILSDDHLWPQAHQLQEKSSTYLHRIATETAVDKNSLGVKGKEKIGKGIDVIAQVWDIQLSKESKLTPYIGVNLPNEGKRLWAIAGMTLSDKPSWVTASLQGEFKEKGKSGNEYIAAKITEQTKIPVSKTESISVMWGIDDNQPTAGIGYTKRLDTGSLTVWWTVTDTEKWPMNLKGDVTRTSKNKNLDISATVQRNKGDVSGGVSAKLRF